MVAKPKTPASVSPDTPAPAADGLVPVVDLATGAIVRLTQAELDGRDPDDFRPATARDIAIGE